MTVSEFGFLAMGALLGLAAGVALIETFRVRPPARREVRVTVTQDAIPSRRAATLSDDAFVSAHPEPARGGPADRRATDGGGAPAGVDRRTAVRSGGPAGGPSRLPTGDAGVGPPRRTPLPAMLTASTVRPARDGAPVSLRPNAELVPVPVSGGEDPLLVALRASATTAAIRSIRVSAPAAVAVLDRPEPPVALAGPGDTPMAEATASSSPTAAPTEAGPCGELRRVAAERCELATRARAQAGTAEDTVRAAQRAYDDHESRAEEAARVADPRAVRAAKDEAQTAFRHDRTAARTTDEIESAARAWLLEINRINTEARDASASVTREREASRRLTLELERLAVEADAARISAATADAACLAAREAAADCDERVAAEATAAEPRVPSGAPDLPFADEATPTRSLGLAGTPRIFRLLRGDRAAMTEVVTGMAGDDPQERKRWQLALAALVDAIIADSIAASTLGFPEDHPFWGPFTQTQDREIASALGSLGYRFDGLGGWVDGRSPSQRDLSLAVGYAGLDPMRIRHWPNEAEMSELFRDVTVAADERLAGAAGDLTLGELVSMLGRRADSLAEVWNDWGRLRPLLLEEH